MKIYTKTGDHGITSLVGGTRIEKSSDILDVYGSIDELNAFVGLLIAEKEIPFLTEIQDNLFVIGGIVATDPTFYEQYWGTVDLSEYITKIENEIDLLSDQLDPLKNFILPQGSKSISYAHICRTICRRTERKMCILEAENLLLKSCMIYVNRLSDYFFILARFFHKTDGIIETYCKLGK